MTYESGTLLSKSEVQKAFSDAIALVKKIFTEAKAQNPQLELKFKLNDEIRGGPCTPAWYVREGSGYVRMFDQFIEPILKTNGLFCFSPNASRFTVEDTPCFMFTRRSLLTSVALDLVALA